MTEGVPITGKLGVQVQVLGSDCGGNLGSQMLVNAYEEGLANGLSPEGAAELAYSVERIGISSLLQAISPLKRGIIIIHERLDGVNPEDEVSHITRYELVEKPVGETTLKLDKEASWQQQ